MNSTSRRDFLVQFAAFVAATTLSARAATSEGKRVWRMGLIGAGWYGAVDLDTFRQVVPIEVVALADPDSEALAQVKQEFHAKVPGGSIGLYRDYREMLAKHNFDLVLIATPDHWHALAAIDSLRAGNHVFLEKPISIDIIEGESIVAAARKYGRLVQVNTQRRSAPHLVAAKREYVDSGMLGRIAYVNAYCYYDWGRAPVSHSEPPAGLDWDLWCGPAPLVPFNKALHPGGWRVHTAFSNGVTADMGVHIIDLVRHFLGLGWPKSVYSAGALHIYTGGSGDAVDTQVVTYDFEQLQLIWQLRMWGEPEDETAGPWGATVFGDKGTLRINPFFAEFKPKGGTRVRHEAFMEPALDPGQPGTFETVIPPSARRHALNFIAAIERGSPLASPVEDVHISSACCILAQLSLKTRRSLRYDPGARTCINDPEATALLRRPYRAPWVHPEPEHV
ncbi:MAG: Gfo/Idh/MocA family oxidoreductase [Opitutaceae bacterium]|nr:Gfo/Idh/MocA family oxidoreductase [Opitutaceae bacterium]